MMKHLFATALAATIGLTSFSIGAVPARAGAGQIAPLYLGADAVRGVGDGQIVQVRHNSNRWRHQTHRRYDNYRQNYRRQDTHRGRGRGHYTYRRYNTHRSYGRSCLSVGWTRYGWQTIISSHCRGRGW